MRLQTRFLITLLIVSAIAFSVAAIVLQNSMANIKQRESDQQLQAHLTLALRNLEQIFQSTQVDADTLSRWDSVIEILGESTPSRTDELETEIHSAFSSFLESHAFYSEFAIINLNGEVYLANGKEEVSRSTDTAIGSRINAFSAFNLINYAVHSGNTYISFYDPVVVLDRPEQSRGFLKVSIDLNLFSRITSSELILVSFQLGDQLIYSKETAASIGISPQQDAAITTNYSTDIGNDLIIRVSMLNRDIVASADIFYRNSLAILLVTMVAFIVITVLLVRLVILRPMRQFSTSIESTDVSTHEYGEAKDFKIFEFQKIQRSFDDLLSRLMHASNELRRQAFTDVLTGLPNRSAFYHQLQRFEKNREPCSLLYIDLNGFKQINDLYGHEAGDLLLVEISRKLVSCVGGHGHHHDSLNIEKEAVFRIGGDEFVALVEVARASYVAEKIISKLNTGITILGKIIYCNVSIGIAEFPKDASEMNQLVQYADLAMYRAKHSSNQRVIHFTQEIANSEMHKLMLEKAIQHGIEYNTFDAHFQAKIDTSNNQVIGFEALARLSDEQGSTLSPLEFISVAQDMNVLEYITCIVLEKTCQMLKKLNDPALIASINLAPSQISDLHLVADMRMIMWHYNIPPQQIELEVTEHELIDKPEVTKTHLQMLRQFGFRTSLDDFGSGYSALSQLKSFEFDTIKLDQDFINSDDFDSVASKGVVSSIKSLADKLNVQVIAEGVEAKSHVDFLNTMGIHFAQGYYFCKPLNGEAFLNFLQDHRSEH